jgi:cell wall-associated NlpC family hydrolase
MNVMLRKLIPAFLVLIILASCSSMKPTHTSITRQPHAPSNTSKTTPSASKEVKFLDDISVEADGSAAKVSGPHKSVSGRQSANTSTVMNSGVSVEKASDLQLKYAVLLNTEVEMLENNNLLIHIDEWYGTRYRYGGTTKAGIDCSAFVQAVYVSAFALNLPRTAREQYRHSRIISATEMKTGDLVFFNTTGGISHVGIYLMNNKFVHASASYGVTISDMFDPYYLKRFIGIGRIEKPEARLTK